MKYIIRSGKVKGEGRYFHLHNEDGDGAFYPKLYPRCRFAERSTADSLLTLAEQIAGEPCRIVRLLSHEEAKQKAKADALRALAQELLDSTGGYGRMIRHTDLRTKADELWPVKGKQ